MNCRLFARHLAIALMCSTTMGFAQDAHPEKTKDDELTTRRRELMQKRVASAVSSREEGFPERFSEKPIFRYTDPARRYVAAAVWKLGDTGRPRAIVTTELHRQYFGKPRIVYEYLSLTPATFFVTGGDFGWMPKGTALEFKPVPDAPPPDETAPRRLRQMRAIVNRFTGVEVRAGQRCVRRKGASSPATATDRPLHAFLRRSCRRSHLHRHVRHQSRSGAVHRIGWESMELRGWPTVRRDDNLLVYRSQNRLGRRTGSLQRRFPVHGFQCSCRNPRYCSRWQ